MTSDLKLSTLLTPFLLKETALMDEEYWGKVGAGVIFVAKKTGRFLLGLRSDEVYEPGMWGTFGGRVEQREAPEDAAEREAREETGYDGPITLKFLYVFKDPDEDFTYYTYLGIVDEEFEPQLNWEHDNYAWVKYGAWPDPLHSGFAKAIRHGKPIIRRFLKSLGYSGMMEAAMDTPPPIIRHEPAPQQAGVMNHHQIKDAYVVAATLWGEARGEGSHGMQAVLNVIMNRAGGDFSKAAGVALKPKQFSVWNSISDPYAYSIKLAQQARDGKLQDAKEFKEAIALVDAAMKGKLQDITGGAKYYFNPKKANPSWAKKLKFLKRIGNHDFYGDLPVKKKP